MMTGEPLSRISAVRTLPIAAAPPPGRVHGIVTPPIKARSLFPAQGNLLQNQAEGGGACNTIPPYALRSLFRVLIEIFQIGSRLALPHGHQVAVPTHQLVLTAHEDVMIVLIACILAPD